METGHENKRYFGHFGNGLGAHLDNLAGPGPGRQILIGLALDLTGPASDAFFGILKQIILTHMSSGVIVKIPFGRFNIAITMPWDECQLTFVLTYLILKKFLLRA